MEIEADSVADKRCHKVIQHLPPENIILKYFISFFLRLFFINPVRLIQCLLESMFLYVYPYSFTSFPTKRHIQDSQNKRNRAFLDTDPSKCLLNSRVKERVTAVKHACCICTA